MNKREKVKRSKEIAYRVGIMLISYMYTLNLDGIFNLPKKGKNIRILLLWGVTLKMI